MNARLFLSAIVVQVMLTALRGGEPQSIVLKGRVTDQNGAPLAGAGVAVESPSIGTYCGSSGEYSLNIPGPGFRKIIYSFTGYESVIKELNLNSTLTLDVTLVQKTTMTEEVIVSATRAGSGTPVTYTDIAGDQIRRQNPAQDLPFLLALTPSLVETSESGTGIGYTGMRIRGTDGSRINVTLDGIPLNDAESQQVFWVDLPDLAASVDNIQVQRGVGTSANGAGAFGASVNIKTSNPPEVPFAEINSSAGSFITLRNMAMAGTGLIAGKFAMQMRYSDIRSAGYIKRTGTNNRSFLMNAMYKTGKSLLKANIILGEEHTGISWWGVPADKLSEDRRYNPAGEYTDESGNIRYYENESDNYKQNHFHLIYNRSLTPSLFLNTALHYTKGEGYYEEYREDQAYSDYGLPDVIIDTTVISYTDLIRRKWMSNDFYGVVYSLTIRKEKLEAVIGGGLNVYKGDHFGEIIWMQYAGNTSKDYQWYLNHAAKGEASIYGKINYRISDNLRGFGDIQYRHITYEMEGIDDDLREITQSHYFDFLNPKAGLFLTIAKNQDAYLSFSVAGREPTRSDFKEATGDDEATPRQETLYDAEAGYSLRSTFATAGINFFGMLYKDQLIPTGELSDVGYPIMTNAESSYRTGLEVTSELRPVNRLEWRLSVTLSTSKIPGFTAYYVDYNTSDWSSQYKSINLGTVGIAYSPSLIGSGDLSYDLTSNLKVHFISKYVGKQYFDNTMSNSRMIDPYFVNNLRFDFSKPFGSGSSIDFKFIINNIFNSLYESNAYGGLWYEDGIEKTWAYYFPQAGINIMGSIGVRF
jgi:iron complex outermembrane receptor protein